MPYWEILLYHLKVVIIKKILDQNNFYRLNIPSKIAIAQIINLDILDKNKETPID